MKKIYIGFAFQHHKYSKGGYHHIKEYMEYDKVIDLQWEKEFYERTTGSIFFKIFRRLYILLLGHGTPLGIIRCVLLATFGKEQIFHFIYAENTYKWLHHFKGKRNKIVLTIHQPSSFFKDKPEWLQVFLKVDGIILMTKSDIEKFEKWTGRKNVYFIPHGIDCSFYTYDSLIQKKNSVLMVGNWLRDFILAKNVFVQLMANNPDIQINIVTNKTNFKYFEDLDLNLYSNITDEELKYLYQSSKVVFFPLIKYTANNAMLEAAACGDKIIVSLPSIPDDSYFSEKLVHYIDDEIDNVVKELDYSIKIDEYANSKNISDFVTDNYSWQIIGKKTESVFGEIYKYQ